MNNNENNSFNMLDMLSLISFMAQMKNMNDDDKTALKNNSIIKAISNEIDRLHKENDNIITYLKEVNNNEQKVLKKLDTLIALLERRL